MKILQIMSSGTVGTRRAGPVSSVAQHLSNEFVALGHQVHLVDAPARSPRTNLDPSIQVYEVASNGSSISWMNQFSTINTSWRRHREIRRSLDLSHYDVLQVHQMGDALIFGRRGEQPLVWTAHNLNWTLRPHKRVSVRGRLNRILDQAACAGVDQIVVLNEQTRRALSDVKVSVIPNGIDLSDWKILDKATARRRLGIPPDEYVVSYFGRVAPEKGVDVFVKSVVDASKTIPIAADVTGSLSGRFGSSNEVTDYARKVSRISDQIRFRGFIHRDECEYRMRMAAADLVVVPSLSEPFGFVVLEALACGARVVGSDTGGIKDILGGGLGCLLPAGDRKALTDFMIRDYQQRDRSQPFRDSTHLTRFKWCDIASRYLEVMQLARRRT